MTTGSYKQSFRLTPEGGKEDEEEIRARLVIGFGNGSFMLLHGSQRLMLIPPSTSSSSSPSSFLPNPPSLFHHLYSLPVSHPACVFLTATGPKSFVAASCPDRLFLWSAEDDEEKEEEEEEEEVEEEGGGKGGLGSEKTEVPVLPLTSAFSKGAPRRRVERGRPKMEEEEVNGEEDRGEAEEKKEYEEYEEDDVLGLSGRHRLDECCDVALLALKPSPEEEEEGREDGKEKEVTVVVTACNHDVSLRWWELNSYGIEENKKQREEQEQEEGEGRRRRGRRTRRPRHHSRAVCTAITPAFTPAWDGIRGSSSSKHWGGMGTVSLAQAGGVLLSAHLNGSLVVWYVRSRRPVAHFHGLPLLECLKMTPRGMDVLTSYERRILYARQVVMFGAPGGGERGRECREGSEEDNAGNVSSGNGAWGGKQRGRDRGKGGGGGVGGGRPRRKNSYA